MALQDTTLLCFVFYLGQRIQAQEGDFPIPTMSAAPSAVVPWNGSVRILCGGTPESFLYQLWHVSENSTHTVVEKKLGFQKEAEFIINHMNTATAGCYKCQYKKKQNWSGYSEPLTLVVTGLDDKPVLSTNHSLVAMLGENIYFQCASAYVPFDRFALAKEGDSSLSQYRYAGHEGNFTVGPMNPNFTGSYRCYGWHSGSPYIWSAPSDAVQLVIAGSLANTAIWAVPGSVISVGSSVTFFCSIPQGVTRVRLFCAEPIPETYDQTIQRAQKVAEFSLLNVTHVNAGLYYCEYWDEGRFLGHSYVLKLVVTGAYKEKPSLIVQSEPEVGSRGTVTLVCRTPHFYNFALCRGTGTSFPQNCSQQDHNTFLISPVSLLERSIYRCYGSPDQMFYLWSLPSDPLELPIPDSRNQDHTVENLIRMGMAGMVLVLLLVISAENWSSHGTSPKGGWKDVAAQSWNQQDYQT